MRFFRRKKIRVKRPLDTLTGSAFTEFVLDVAELPCIEDFYTILGVVIENAPEDVLKRIRIAPDESRCGKCARCRALQLAWDWNFERDPTFKRPKKRNMTDIFARKEGKSSKKEKQDAGNDGSFDKENNGKD